MTLQKIRTPRKPVNEEKYFWFTIMSKAAPTCGAAFFIFLEQKILDE